MECVTFYFTGILLHKLGMHANTKVHVLQKQPYFELQSA